MIKEKPILFSGPMIRAILDGRKTQTRRVIKPSIKGCTVGAYTNGQKRVEPVNVQEDGDPWTDIKCPYGLIGDGLWVRETFNSGWCDHTIYKADGGSAKDAGYSKEPKWTPSIHMKRIYSRINLEITDIRVEQLQDITEEDAKAEGMEAVKAGQGEDSEPIKTYRTGFVYVWNSINGEPRADGLDISWKANPWVWVVTFKKEKLC